MTTRRFVWLETASNVPQKISAVDSGSVVFPSANSDIQVSCGSQTVDLQILLCPIYFNGYNESLLALNSEHSKPQCKGTPDWTADPPVINFNVSITEEGASACSNDLTVRGPTCCHPAHTDPSSECTLFFLTGHGGGGNRSLGRFLQRSVHQRLRDGLLRGPQRRSHHLPPGGHVPLLLPLPPAVPGQQHSDERVRAHTRHAHAHLTD